MRAYSLWLLRVYQWLLRGAGSYHDVPNIKVSRVAVFNFQAAVVIWRAAKFFSNHRSIAYLAGISEWLFRNATKSAPLWIHAHRGLGNLILFQGRHEEGLAQLGHAERLRNKLAKVAGWKEDTKVFLPRGCCSVLGGIGLIDGYVKHKILTGDPRPYYLLADPIATANSIFLSYWSDYVTIVTDPTKIAELAKFEAVYGVGWMTVMPRGDTYVHVHRGISAVQRQWSKESRSPLLLLRDEHRDLLVKYKAKIGMAEKDWYICLHVRSHGFHSERRGGSEDIRNAPIEDYYSLIRDVVAAGGWVVRMGDSSMPALDMSKCGGDHRVIDFALSFDKSAALDVALGASCRLFVGHSSGFHTIPHAFGRPCCMVNIPLTAGFPWHPDDIFVPKKYVSVSSGAALSLAQLMSSTNILNADNIFQLAQAELVLLPNEPDELVEAMREALAAQTNLKNPSVADEVIKEFDRLNQTYHAEISGTLSSYYAAKHANTLLAREQ